MRNRETITFEMDADEYHEVQEFLDNSLMFDSQSQLCRAAVRLLIAEQSDDFSGAQ